MRKIEEIEKSLTGSRVHLSLLRGVQGTRVRDPMRLKVLREEREERQKEREKRKGGEREKEYKRMSTLTRIVHRRVIEKGGKEEMGAAATPKGCKNPAQPA